MNKLTIFLTLLLTVCDLKHSIGIKWLSMKSGDELPTNAIYAFNYNGYVYVGRSKYVNGVVLADINVNHHTNKIINAVINHYNHQIVLTEFEVLVADRNTCQWTQFDESNIHEDIVRGGTAWNLEPFYVGKDINDGIATIFLTSKKTQYKGKYAVKKFNGEILICENNHIWRDKNSASVPDGVVATPDNQGYVVRILGPKSFLPAVAYPDLNVTKTFYGIESYSSFEHQVLVDYGTQFKWKIVNTQTESIPEEAVVFGVSENNELIYLAYRNGAMAITFSDMIHYHDSIHILIETF